MEYKKDLKQIALTALFIASMASVNAQIDEEKAQELSSLTCAKSNIFLAMTCGAHTCASAAKNIMDDKKADSSSPKSNESTKRDVNDEPFREKKPQGTPSQQTNRKIKKSEELAYMSPRERALSDSSYNSGRSGMTSPVYVEDYRSDTFYSPAYPYPEYRGMTSLNREYNTTTDYDYNRASVVTVTSSNTLTEAQLLGLLNSQGVQIYLNLDPEGKSLAIQLASQDSYLDKNLAVKEAQRRMNERRGLIYRRY